MDTPPPAAVPLADEKPRKPTTRSRKTAAPTAQSVVVSVAAAGGDKEDAGTKQRRGRKAKTGGPAEEAPRASNSAEAPHELPAALELPTESPGALEDAAAAAAPQGPQPAQPQTNLKTAAKKPRSAAGGGSKKMKVYTAVFEVDAAGERVGQQPPSASFISEDENVILQLKVSAAGEQSSASDVPGAYNEDASVNTLAPASPMHGGLRVQDPQPAKWLAEDLPDKAATAPPPAGAAECCGCDMLDSLSSLAVTPAAAAPEAPPPPPHAQAGPRVVRLLMDLEEKSKVCEWPANTSVHCYWCCHKFNNTPYGLPIKFVHGKFQVTGCFCSLECAASWNFASKESLDEIYERHSLINLLSSHIGYRRSVRPAPDRVALAMFGGHMSIHDFRAFCDSSKLVLSNFPPMLSLTQQVEEVNDTELRSEYKFIPIDSDRVNKYQEKIKLRRTKPLVNFKNTLDCTMNLRYH